MVACWTRNTAFQVRIPAGFEQKFKVLYSIALTWLEIKLEFEGEPAYIFRLIPPLVMHQVAFCKAPPQKKRGGTWKDTKKLMFMISNQWKTLLSRITCFYDENLTFTPSWAENGHFSVKWLFWKFYSMYADFHQFANKLVLLFHEGISSKVSIANRYYLKKEMTIIGHFYRIFHLFQEIFTRLRHFHEISREFKRDLTIFCFSNR